MSTYTDTCPRCEGSGTKHKETCPTCGGKGTAVFLKPTARAVIPEVIGGVEDNDE